MVSASHALFLFGNVMKIVPIAITMPDWPRFVDYCQNTLGYSPTRGLDEQGISITDTKSFLASLALDNNPSGLLNKPSESNQFLRHISLVVIAEIPQEVATRISMFTTLDITCVLDGKHTIYYVSGHLLKWYHAISAACRVEHTKEFRLFGNECHNVFQEIGLGFLWNKKEWIGRVDGTFLLG